MRLQSVAGAAALGVRHLAASGLLLEPVHKRLIPRGSRPLRSSCRAMVAQLSSSWADREGDYNRLLALLRRMRG
jgi:hypothetical protein